MWLAKAMVGGVLAGAAAIGTALEAHSGTLTNGDIGPIILAFVAGFNGVYWTPNKTRGKISA